MLPSSLLPLDLASDDFRDRVNGCWMGKNCGGTLGAPLEKVLGEPEPLDVWWYPRLEAGGIPNDDLEMQLFWLKALEEVGPGLRAADLSQYWLDHILYNPDEYGFAKTNLRLGLLPPVAGAYNNWFKDCMGCPIRSEIWACVAPGAPRVACLYAYEDGIVDHAGGESLYGEFFNTAVESAAFVVPDRDTLIAIGLSYVPESTLTYRAMRAALDAHAAGVDWQEARRRVLAATPHYNAQYAPLNLAFQLIGWLYGDDFGDVICKAVNCGYDTDCTAATVGSFLGIMHGRRGLPTRWTEPLGETIATSERGGGVRHTLDGSNPVPTTIDELTARVMRQAVRVLAYHGVTPGRVPLADLYADERILALAASNPMRVDFPAAGFGTLGVGVDYGHGPAVRAGENKKLITTLTNPRLEAMHAGVRLQAPAGWTVSPPEQPATVSAGGETSLAWEVTVPGVSGLEGVNTLFFQVAAAGRPAQPAVPIPLIGAARYRRTEVFPAEGRTELELLRAALEPERLSGDGLSPDGRPGKWEVFDALDNALPLAEAFDSAGVMYVQAFVHSPVARVRSWSGASVAAGLARMWVNGELKAECARHVPFRPSQAGGNTADALFARIELRPGWNEVLFKLVRGSDAPPLQCHVTFSGDGQHDALTDLGRTRLPWEA